MITARFYWGYLFSHKIKPVMLTRSMLKVAFPLLVVSASSIASNSADTMMLGWLGSARDVGLYNVAAKIGLITSFLHIITASVISPKAAALYEQGKKVELEKMSQQISIGLTITGFLSLIIFVLFGKYILQLWGVEFIAGYSVLVIITIGQFFNISTGPTGLILIMTGHEKFISIFSTIILSFNLILNFILIPKYGINGAAFSTTLTIIASNIIKVYILRKRVGINIIPLKYFNL